VRYVLPGLVCVAGLVIIAVSSDDARRDGGAAILGAGLAIYLINFLFRVGAGSDRERDDEERARRFFEEHGFWPDDEPPAGGDAPGAGSPDDVSER